MGSIPANSDAQNVPSFRRWRFEMKLSPFFFSVIVLCSNHKCDTWFFTRYRFLLQGQPPLIVRDSREPPSRCPIIISIHIFISIPLQCLFESKIDALFYSYVLHEIISYPESKIDVDMLAAAEPFLRFSSPTSRPSFHYAHS